MNRWHTDPRACSHSNADVCPTCDFDSYYALTYDDCPWRAERLAADGDPLRDDAAREATAAYRGLVDPVTGRLTGGAEC